MSPVNRVFGGLSQRRGGPVLAGTAPSRDDGAVRPLRWVVLGILAAWPALLVLLTTRSGIALSQDSVSYLAAAQALSDGRGPLDYDGELLTLFPPGFPALLGLLASLGVPVTTGAVAVNTVSAALVIVGTYALGMLATHKVTSSLAAAAVVSLSASFTGVFVWLWTEPVFTAFTLGILILLAWSIQNRRMTWPVVVVLGLGVSAACTVRYVGAALIPIAIVGVWWATSGGGRARAVGHSVAVALISSIGLMGVVLANVSAGAGALGDRYPGSRTIESAVLDVVGVVGAFVLPPESSTLGVLFGVAVIVAAAVSAWVAWIIRDRVSLLLTLFFLLFVLLNVWSQGSTRLDSPSARLLAPIVPALAVLAVAGFVQLARRAGSDLRGWAAASQTPWVRERGASVMTWLLLAGALILPAGALFANVRADQRMISMGNSDKLGIGGPESEARFLSATQGVHDARGFASNDPWTTFLASGLPSTFLPPPASEWPVERLERDRDALARAVVAGRVTHAVVFADEPVGQWQEDLASVGVDAQFLGSSGAGEVYRLLVAPPASGIS